MASLFRPLLRTRAPAAVIRSSFAARTFTTTPSLSEILKRYTKDHEWIALDTSSSIATVGVTKHAAEALGDVVYVELNEASSEVEPEGSFGSIESVKSASDLISPVAGEIIEANDAVLDTPRLVNADPEGESWLVKIKVEGGESALEGLLDQAAYEEFVSQ